MRRIIGWSMLGALALGCDDGGGETPTPVPDMAEPDQAVVDMVIEPDMPIEPDMMIVDMMPDQMPDMMPVDMAPGRRPTGIDAPFAQACPANHREPQVVIEVPDGFPATLDGAATVARVEPGVFTVTAGADVITLRVPRSADAALRTTDTYELLWRQQTRGYVEQIVLLRNGDGQIVFVAGSGTSWMLQQFSAREAVREQVTLAGRCDQEGDRCYDRIDREMIFANANRRRALLPGDTSDFTTDGGTFQLHVDQAYQVACAVLCPNVANQWFSIWMVRDFDVLMPDYDDDGVFDDMDLCPAVPNEGPADTDMDGIGDVCDQAPETEGPGLACRHPLDCPSRVCQIDQICRAGRYVVPGAPEVCDGYDNDGNGEIDEGLAGCEGEADWCRVGADIAAEGELMRTETGALTATPTLDGACDGVMIQSLSWDINEDGESDGEGERIELRRLRGMNAIPVVLRITDSRGGITEVQARVPVAESEYCP